jgi:HTH-type transcriptional regulator / antitoxin HigA
MKNKLVPARVSPPGQIISRELAAREWTQKDLAQIINRPEQTISAIVNGTKQITPETALELASAFGTSAEFWTNLESNYRLFLARSAQKNDEIERKSKLYKFAPIAEMAKRGWINLEDSIDGLERQLFTFFEIDSLEATPKFQSNFRCNRQKKPATIAQLAWLKRVESIANTQSLPPFDLAIFKAKIPDILALNIDPANISILPQMLMNVGVHFVVVPHLQKTYLDGATFWLNDSLSERLRQRPAIAMTLRYDRIDYFWFTLMHEIAHIWLEHEGYFLDDIKNIEDTPIEYEADSKAADWLVSQDILTEFLTNNRRLSKDAIAEFARSQNIHPGIIVGRLQKIGKVPYQHHRKFLVNVKQYLPEWIYGDSTA